MTARNKVLDRARKLLALAKSSNVHEAAAAAGAAQRLLEAHRLDLAALTRPEGRPRSVRLHDEPLDEGARLAAWKIDLAMVVSEANCARVVVLRDGRYAVLQIVGQDEDVGAARVLYSWLVSEIQRLARASGVRGRAALDSFRFGAVSTIEQRLARVRREVRKQARKAAHAKADSTALVKVGMTAMAVRDGEAERLADEICEGREDWISEHEPEFDAGAFVTGTVLGDSIDLAAQKGKLRA